MTRSTTALSFCISLLNVGLFTLLVVGRHDDERAATFSLDDRQRSSGSRPRREGPLTDSDAMRPPGSREAGGSGPLVARALEAERQPTPLSNRGPDLLRSHDPRQRCRGLRALETEAEYDPEALAAIRGALGDPDARVRIEAVQTLMDVEDRAAVPELRNLLDDPEPGVRGETIEALVELGGDPESATIAALLSDGDAGVRADAAAALGSLRSHAVVDSLVAALGDADREVREQVILALDRLRATSALPALAALHATGDGAPSFRLLDTMRRLGDDGPYRREIDRLSHIALADLDTVERYRAIRMLERHARSEARDVFRRALGDPSARVRKAAARAVR